MVGRGYWGGSRGGESDSNDMYSMYLPLGFVKVRRRETAVLIWVGFARVRECQTRVSLHGGVPRNLEKLRGEPQSLATGCTGGMEIFGGVELYGGAPRTYRRRNLIVNTSEKYMESVHEPVYVVDDSNIFIGVKTSPYEL